MQRFTPLGAPGLGGGDGAQADPPDPAKLPQDDILGITAVLLTCLYGDKVRPSRCSRRRPPAALLPAALWYTPEQASLTIQLANLRWGSTVLRADAERLLYMNTDARTRTNAHSSTPQYQNTPDA